MVLKRKILCGPRVGCYLGSRTHHGYMGSTTGEKMHASFLPATLTGLGNVTSLSMWLGQQRSCTFANADRLLMIFTAVLLVLILQLPRLGTPHRSHHRSHKHMCMHMSGKKWERTRALHGFCPDMEWRLGQDIPPSPEAVKHSQVLQFTHSSSDQPQKYMWRRVSNLLNAFTLQNSHIQWQTSSSQATGCADRPTNISGYLTGRDSSPVCAQLVCTSVTSPMHPGYLQPTAHTVELASAGAANEI